MKCPACKGLDNYVLETRKQANVVWRRRACNECGNVFPTSETLAVRLPVGLWNNVIPSRRLLFKGRKVSGPA